MIVLIPGAKVNIDSLENLEWQRLQASSICPKCLAILNIYTARLVGPLLKLRAHDKREGTLLSLRDEFAKMAYIDLFTGFCIIDWVCDKIVIDFVIALFCFDCIQTIWTWIILVSLSDAAPIILLF